MAATTQPRRSTPAAPKGGKVEPWLERIITALAEANAHADYARLRESPPKA